MTRSSSTRPSAASKTFLDSERPREDSDRGRPVSIPTSPSGETPSPQGLRGESPSRARRRGVGWGWGTYPSRVRGGWGTYPFRVRRRGWVGGTYPFRVRRGEDRKGVEAGRGGPSPSGGRGGGPSVAEMPACPPPGGGLPAVRVLGLHCRMCRWDLCALGRAARSPRTR